MKRSKKSLLLIIAMIVMLLTASLAMTACGSGDAKGDDSNNTKTEQSADNGFADEPIDDEEAAADNEKSDKTDSGKSDSKSGKTDKKETNKTSATKATQATQPATEAAKVCYVSVEGYCSGKAITLQGGDTAYSVLTRTGASVSAENSSMGVYVNGINGRFASGSSGWKYSVNGWEPNYSAGKYAVQPGDKVSWYWGSAY